MLKPGAAILIPSGPPSEPGRMHMHVVVARKSGPPAQLLLACICSINEGRHYDKTAVFKGGEHSFIRHPSYIRYSVTRIDSEAQIERGIKNQIFELKESLDADVLVQIQNGFHNSRFAKPFATNFLEECD